jgi:hypothetical protein
MLQCLRILPIAVTLWLASTRVLYADCVASLLTDRLKDPAVEIVLRGTVTQVREIRTNPTAQEVTLRVDRVWKGEPAQTFVVYNVPLDWTPLVPQRSPGGGFVLGRTLSSGYGPFQPDRAYVVVARQLSSHERQQLQIGDGVEAYGTAFCRDGSRIVEQAERNREFEMIGPGRDVRSR